MRKILFSIIVALIVLVPIPEISVSARTAGILEYTTTPQKVVPSAANCTNVTPSGTGGAFSAWTQIIASTSTDIAVSSIVWKAAGSGFATITVELGIGGAGAESTVITLAVQDAKLNPSDAVIPIRPVLAAFPAGSRVSLRMAKGGTDTTAWCYALSYYELPLLGLTTTSTGGNKLNASQTSNGSSWANSTWTQATASAPSDLLITGLQYSAGDCSPNNYSEYDIGTGAAASEVVKWTGAGYVRDPGTGLCTDDAGPHIIPVNPQFIITSGTRIAARMRKNLAGAVSYTIQILYQTPGSAQRLVTAAVQKMVPSAANNTTVTAGGSAWASGSWVQFIASTSTAIALTAINTTCSCAGANEYDIGIGSVGNEVVIGTIRLSAGAAGDESIAINPAINIASGQRVSVRSRNNAGGNSTFVKLGYIENPDFDQRTDLLYKTYPAAASLTLTTNAVAWANSSWAELTSSTANSILLTSVSFRRFSSSNQQIEFDIGEGSAGNEVVATTLRTYNSGQATEGVVRHQLAIPLLIPKSTRVSIRTRNSIAGAFGAIVGVDYIDAYIPPSSIPWNWMPWIQPK